MCGPLVGSLALAAGPRGVRRSLAGQLAYHAGRITTYGAVGAVMGLTGSFVNVAGRLAGVQHAVAIAAGVLMILLGAGVAGLSTALRRLEARASLKVIALVRGLLEGGGPGRLYPTGLALGPPPCGLSWTVFLGAAGTGSVPEGLLLALAFGIGTTPALLLAGRRRRRSSAPARAASSTAPGGAPRRRCSGSLFVCARGGSGERRGARGCAVCCDHCLLEFPAREAVPRRRSAAPTRVFCCGGCRGVFRARVTRRGSAPTTRRGAGRAGRAGAADGGPAIVLRVPRRGPRAAAAADEVELYVDGIRCASCVWLNERLLSRTPGRARPRA